MKAFTHTILPLIFFLSLAGISHAQRDSLHPLSDALEYHKMVKAAEATSDPKTRKGYFGKALTIVEKYDTCCTTGSNPNSALYALIYHVDSLKPLDKTSTVRIDGEPHSTETAVIGAADMIDELSKIIAERFREELTIAFLERFRVKLKSDSLLADVFPNTRRVLLYDDPFNYDSWLSSFRGALHLDLSAIPQRVPEIVEGIVYSLDSPNSQEFIDKITPYLADLKLLKGFIDHPEHSYQNLDGLLQSIAQNDSKLITKEETRKFIGYGRKIVHELSTPDYRHWASDEDFKAITTDPNKLKTFSAFFLYKYKDELSSLKTADSISILSALSAQKSNGEELKFFKQVIFDVKEVAAQINTIQSSMQNGQKNLVDQYLKLTTETFELAGTIVKQYESDSVVKKWAKIEVALNAITDMQADIANENYAEILPGLLRALDTLVPSEALQKSVFLKEVLKYANLAVALSTAQSSEEFADALEGAILPTQSYRLKRSALFSISVNAYAGGFYAQERLLDPAVKSRKGGIAGFTAPIGLGFNWGLTKAKPGKYSQTPVVTKYALDANNKKYVANKRYYTGHSLSIFASVIDVGAVVAFRLQDTVAPSAQVQWKNILAPGAYVIWGIGKTPLSLQLGAQYGPELRKVEILDGATTTTINSRAWRFGAALTVDIPLFNIYSKTERVQSKLRGEP